MKRIAHSTRRIFRGLLAVGLFAAAVLAGRGQNRSFLLYRADDSEPVPQGDTSVTLLWGNVVFYHNGAWLTCDSAILYNRHYAEGFGQVVINRDSTYIYGDRATIDGQSNLAKVFSPIVKTVDGGMTMYSTDELEFNTLTKIGRFVRGGTITQKDNLIEAREGIYHVDERDIYFRGAVNMRNEEYLLRTDSMGYNFDTEIARFYRPAQIWNKDGDYLSADRGYYDRAGDRYHFEQNSYVLTVDQEIFSDTLVYMKTAGLAGVSGDAQIHDREQKSYLWGDYGVYWTQDHQAVMSEDPSAMNYDAEEGAVPDSVWLRGELLMLHTFPSDREFTDELAASLVLPTRQELDSMRLSPAAATTLPRPDTTLVDSPGNWGHLYGEGADTTLLERGMRGSTADSLPLPAADSLPSADSTAVDSLPRVPMPDTGIMVDRRGEIPLLDAPPSADTTAAPLVDTPVRDSMEVVPEKTLTKREQRRAERLERRRAQMRALAVEQGLIPPADSLPAADSLPSALDSLPAVDSLTVAAADSTAAPRDSLQRVFRALRRAKIFRSDMQAVCDSLLAFSLDSTAHLYIDPILWNEQNQITSDTVHVFSRNRELYRADFGGKPIMAQWVIDSLFNQLTGDRMEAYFSGNELRLLKALNNAHALYYSQEEDKPGEIGFFADMRARDMHFLFNDSMQLQFVKAYVDGKSELYPMDKIPSEGLQRLPGFVWLGTLRPASRWDVSARPLKPSAREASEAIPYPAFPITERIEGDKKRSREAGKWRDRNEQIDVDPSIFGILEEE